MKCIVQKSFNAQTVRGQMEMQTVQIINIPDDKALLLIQQGKVSLADREQHIYQERAAIMEHDGGRSRDQAGKLSWCREICMLTSGQAKDCREVVPCPKESQ